MDAPDPIRIWHNPRCSKSRQALDLLQQRLPPARVEVIDYLNTPPSRETLGRVATLLDGGPAALVRFKEDLARTLGLAREDEADKLLDALATHPRLIERPVLMWGDRALIARPPELLLEWLDGR